jgi:hypothetical protein
MPDATDVASTILAQEYKKKIAPNGVSVSYDDGFFAGTLVDPFTREYAWFYQGIVRKKGEIEIFELVPLDHGHNLRPGEKVPTKLAQKLTEQHLKNPENQGLAKLLKLVSVN